MQVFINIPCLDCDKSYYGQTGRSINQRISEHKRSIRYGQENSSVFQHVKDTGHRINWDLSKIIFKSKCMYKRKIIESAVIQDNINFNLSVGQWGPDIVDKLLLRPHLDRIKINLSRPPEQNR